MLGTGTTRPQPDAPDQADDLVGYLRRGPRELPPGIPAAPDRRRPRPIVPALACVAALAGLLVGCQIVKQAPTHSASASPSLSQPSHGATGGKPTPPGRRARPRTRQAPCRSQRLAARSPYYLPPRAGCRWR